LIGSILVAAQRVFKRQDVSLTHSIAFTHRATVVFLVSLSCDDLSLF